MGVLIAVISLRTTFYFQAVVAFSAIPAALTLVEPDRKKLRNNRNFQQIFKIIQYAVFEHRGLQSTIIYSSVIGTATLTMAWFVHPYFVFLGLPLAFFGIMIPLLNLTAGFLSMHAYRFEQRFGRESIILFIAVGIPSGYFCLGMFNMVGGLFCLFLFYIIRGIATPVLKNHINEITPSPIRATVLSIRSLIIRLCFVILGPVLGWQADRAGLSSTFVIISAFFLLTGVFSAFFLINSFRRKEDVSAGKSLVPGHYLSGL